MDLELDERRGWNAVDVALYLLGIAGLAASLTIVWLSMRAVMGVGGYCAEGGPYVIAQHCPDGVALLMPLSIFAGLGSAALMGWKGSTLGGPYGGLVMLAWPALFISLGWNFLEFALFPPPPNTGIELGWLIPGVLFVIMGAVPLIGLLPGANRRSTASAFVGTTGAPYDFEKEGEARYSRQLRKERAHLLADLVEHAVHQAAEQSVAESPDSSPSTDTEGDDLVSRLERLSVLYRSGSLSYDEFQRAKQALILEAGG